MFSVLLPAIPMAFDYSHCQPHRMRSGSVKSVTFDEKLTYYGESTIAIGGAGGGVAGGGGTGVVDSRTAEGTFEHHFYDEVKYPPTLSDQKNI